MTEYSVIIKILLGSLRVKAALYLVHNCSLIPVFCFLYSKILPATKMI